jgi:hypothetical protein
LADGLMKKGQATIGTRTKSTHAADAEDDEAEVLAGGLLLPEPDGAEAEAEAPEPDEPAAVEDPDGGATLTPWIHRQGKWLRAHGNGLTKVWHSWTAADSAVCKSAALHVFWTQASSASRNG